MSACSWLNYLYKKLNFFLIGNYILEFEINSIILDIIMEPIGVTGKNNDVLEKLCL